MIKSNFIRVITLVFFAGMLTAFLLYRTGKFDSYFSAASIQQSPNGGLIKTQRLDTTKLPSSRQRKTQAISSSKVLILTDDLSDKSTEAFDDSIRLSKTVKNLNKELWIQKKQRKIDSVDQTFFAGSKSSAVFKPSDFIISDSIVFFQKEKNKPKKSKP